MACKGRHPYAYRSAAATVMIMSDDDTAEDPLAGLDPRRRAALERIRQQFKDAGGDKVSLVDELIAERRAQAAAEDGPNDR